MTKKTIFNLIIFFVVIFVAFAALLFYLAISGNYPIAMVNSKFISVNDFNRTYQASSNYYKNAAKTYFWRGFDTGNGDTQNILKLATLNDLIEVNLIRDEAKNMLGSEAALVINNKISKIVSNDDFKKATEALYGESFSDYEKDFLIPKAEREVVEGRLFLAGKNIDEWLKSAKAAASIIILVPGYHWDGSAVVIK